MIHTRPLSEPDRDALLDFLGQHPNTTLILHGHLLNAGLAPYQGERYQGHWVGAFEEDSLVGVLAHFWNNYLVFEAPRGLLPLVDAAARLSGRPLRGLIGPWEQLVAARTHLAWDNTPTHLDSRELLYSLDLTDLIEPPTLASGALLCRRPEPGEIDLLITWREAYCIEALEMEPGPTVSRAAREGVERNMGQQWVLVRSEATNTPIATSAFSARTPDCVQVAGVWTPPEQRGRGYGRAVVAGTLFEARREGVARSVLFTDEKNIAAQRAYEALGYKRCGEYGIVIFT